MTVEVDVAAMVGGWVEVRGEAEVDAVAATVTGRVVEA